MVKNTMLTTDKAMDDSNGTNATTSLSKWQLVNEKAFTTAVVFAGLAQILGKWILGVMLRKLIEAAYGVFPADGNESSNGLYSIIFFGGLSFMWMAVISLCLSIVGVIAYALVASWATIQAGQVGRQLRHDILKRAIQSSGGTEGRDVERVANELIVKVRVIEDFKSYDEHSILKTKVLIVVAGFLTMIFAWYGGIVAILLFGVSEIFTSLCERRRHPHIVGIEKNAAQVNARLLDVIRNGVKTKIMNHFRYEQDTLAQLEKQSDIPRAKDAQIKFYREAFQNGSLSIIPAMMGIVGSGFLSRMSTMEEGIDIAYSIMLLTLILDEAYKGIWVLVIALDKRVGAVEAQAAIDDFLGTSSSLMNKNEKEMPSVSPRTSNASSDGEGRKNDDIEAGNSRRSSKAPVWQRMASLPDTTKDTAAGIELENVVLHYPGRDQPVLDHYSHQFQRGKIHGLVGESGSGKSTALKVIADLIEPETGNMTYWKGIKIAYVSQDQKLFARSIRENITYGETYFADEDIWTALRLAQMEEWVQSLPNGLDHVLVNGEGEVSGGQLQRLNLAHLFCTGADADLVILDEVLSALDPKSRNVLLERLESFLKTGTRAGVDDNSSKPKTSLLITHHHEMLTICDQVHEMQPPNHISSDPQQQQQQPRSSRRISNEVKMFRLVTTTRRTSHSASEPFLLGDNFLSPFICKEVEQECD